MPITTTLRHITFETGDVQTTSQEQVSGSTIEHLTPLLEQALASANRTEITRTKFWFTASDSGDLLRAAIGHAHAGDAVLFELTVRPPESDGQPATLQVSRAGAFEAVTSGALDPEEQETVVYPAAFLERCIAWTWLELREFATRDKTDPIDPVDALRSVPTAGTMTHTIADDATGQPLVVFLVRVERHWPNVIPEDPAIDLLSTLFRVGNVFLIPVVAKIGPTSYETWINICSDDNRGFQTLELLAKQDHLVFNLYHDTPSEPMRTIRTHNSLAHNMAEMLPVLENVPQWSMQAFDAAREKLHPQYPNTQAIPNHGAELQ